MKYYKFLTQMSQGTYSGFLYEYYLPGKKRPGFWLPKEKVIGMCQVGYHACTVERLTLWMDAQLFEAELKGYTVTDGLKVVGQQIRLVRKIESWNAKTQRIFGVWCAREMMNRIKYPDPDSVEACNVAERFANGKATECELAEANNRAVGVVYSTESGSLEREVAKAAAWTTSLNMPWWYAGSSPLPNTNKHLIEMLGLEVE